MSVRRSSNNPLRREGGLRTWIEIDERAVARNYALFRKLLAPGTKLWSVVKSNAYGHGLFLFSSLLERLGADGFCVDSAVEGFALRRHGVRAPILVLGPTLPALYPRAKRERLTVSIASPDALKSFLRSAARPEFHLKIDTGMHRQGFGIAEIPRALGALKGASRLMTGVFTHFASAKDINYPSYTERQTREFDEALRILQKHGSAAQGFLAHCAATGGAMADPRYHRDAVRVGIGLYGHYPSKELEMQLPSLRLAPVLSWRTVVAEVKEVAQGEFVGYDLTERMRRKTTVAVLPVGYWHGLPRSLSGVGEVLIRGRRARILGRISMDLTIVDATGIPVRAGDRATIIGSDGRETLHAYDVAQKAGTIHYELLTRLNPLMERILI